MFELGTVGGVLANEMDGKIRMLMSSEFMTVTAKRKSCLFESILSTMLFDASVIARDP